MAFKKIESPNSKKVGIYRITLTEDWEKSVPTPGTTSYRHPSNEF